MKINKNLLTIFLACAFVLELNVTADAQKRGKRATKKRTTAAAAAVRNAANASEIEVGAEKVSTQVKNLSRFIYVLGGIARNIEEIDREAKTGRFSGTVVGQNETNKKGVILGIRNLRAGLATLETEFRAKSVLRPYLFEIQGINDLGAQAEDAATAGKFVDSGKVLLTIVEKLSDTLVAMP